MMRVQLRELTRPLLFGLGLGILGYFFLWLIFSTVLPIPTTIVKNEIADAFFATCEVRSSGGVGTGVLLETGYVITAAHNLDVDLNGTIDKKERKVKLTFHTSTGEYDVRGRALHAGFPLLIDVGIIELPFKMKSRIKLAVDEPLIGDKLFTIGCSNGGSPHLTYGHESFHNHPLRGRASLDAYLGNSGGGIFNEKQELVGILESIGADRTHVHIRVPFTYTSNGKKKNKTATAHINYKQVVPGWVEYCRSTDIHTYLSAMKIPSTVVSPVVEKDYGVFIIYLRMLLHLMGVLACVWFIRKEALG